MSNFIFSNEQKSIFEYDKNDVIQVNGSPGSGKTLVAIKKAILLAEKYNKKVLFLYYNKSLGYEIRRLFGTFDEYSLLKNKIVIDHFLSFKSDYKLNSIIDIYSDFQQYGLPIANTPSGDSIILSSDGKVRFFNHNIFSIDEEVGVIANNFLELLEKLY